MLAIVFRLLYFGYRVDALRFVAIVFRLLEFWLSCLCS